MWTFSECFKTFWTNTKQRKRVPSSRLTYSTVVGTIATHSNNVAARRWKSNSSESDLTTSAWGNMRKYEEICSGADQQTTHSMFCSASTSWVFWSGAMRAKTVPLSTSCSAPVWTNETITAASMRDSFLILTFWGIYSPQKLFHCF